MAARIEGSDFDGVRFFRSRRATFFRVAFYADGVNVRGREFGSYSQLINRFTQPV
jgi:hypothetical protein